MKTDIPDTVEEIEISRFERTPRREVMMAALMRLAKRMISSDREHLLLGLYYQEEEDMRTGSIIGRFKAVESTGKRSEWASGILKEIMERSIFEYSNAELAKIIREGPEKTDPLKHLDYEGKMIAKAVEEGSRRQVLAYLESH